MKLPEQIRKMTVKQFKEQYNEDPKIVIEEDAAKRLQPLIGNAHERPGTVPSTPKKNLTTPMRPSFAKKRNDEMTPSRSSSVRPLGVKQDNK